MMFPNTQPALRTTRGYINNAYLSGRLIVYSPLGGLVIYLMYHTNGRRLDRLVCTRGAMIRPLPNSIRV